MIKPILITGATGNTGRVVAERLRERGVPFLAMARSLARERELAEHGIEARSGDFDDLPSMVRALAGIETAYLVCTPDELLIPREVAFIRAAKQAGVRRIVKCSAYWADLTAETANLRAHGAIESELIHSGLEYTIIRPHGFMQSFTLFSWGMIEKAGAMSMPAGEGGIPLIDVRDVAEVAVRALLEPGHHGKAYDLTGPDILTMYDQAAILERVLGRPVTYVPGNEAQLLRIMKLLGVPPVPTEHVIKVFRMQRDHRFETKTSTLRELGITPITYEQFVHDLIAGKTGGGNSFQPPRTPLIRAMDAVMPVAMRAYLRIRGREREPERRSA
ncbi:SDR family oxidoreductase [Nannocystaceae bacterium ST9]